MNFHSHNQSIVTRLESAAMLQATEPDDSDIDGETVEYAVEEFEIAALGGLSLGVWTISFTAISCAGGWEHGPVTIENVDRGKAVTVNLSKVRDDPTVAAAYGPVDLAILHMIGAYLAGTWSQISAQCDAVVAER